MGTPLNALTQAPGSGTLGNHFPNFRNKINLPFLFFFTGGSYLEVHLLMRCHLMLKVRIIVHSFYVEKDT